MGLVWGTLSIYLTVNVVGVLWTMCILKWGIPKAYALQGRPHTWATFRQRLPLVLFNTVVLLTMTGFGLHAMRDWFDSSPPALSTLGRGGEDGKIARAHRAEHYERRRTNKRS